jgi:hypothetical protein
MDEHRRKWTHYLYGVDWGDPTLYDMVLNLEHISVEEACNVLVATVRERCFTLTPQCQVRMNDLAIASRVRANLALNPPTSGLEVEVTAAEGRVRIRGRLAGLEQLEEVRRVATNSRGVVEVNLQELSLTAHS